MKTKGIPFWEQHLEHFVVAIAVLVLLGFAAMQFTGDPNSVDIPGSGKVGPGQIDPLLETKAKSILDKIGGPALEVPKPAPALETFNSKKLASISPQPTLPVPSPRLSPFGNIVTPAADRPFMVAQVPACRDLLTHQYFDTLSQETVNEHEALKKSLPEAAPYDISWITVASTFDVAAVLKQFGEPGPKGEAPLPPKWYNNRVDFV